VRVCGLDPSLTSFGGAVVQGPGVAPELFRFQTKLTGHPRLAYLMSEVMTIARGCDVAVVEGAPFSRLPGAQTHMALVGLHWLVRHALYEMGVPYAVVEPASRVLWLTGKGKAEKVECVLEVVKRFPLVDVRGDDEADAFTLAAMGAAAYGLPLVKMPADREAVLRRVRVNKRTHKSEPVIDWPRLAALAADAG
jgi:Holliday junction resolvasome RuvABC endonuclease subunit